FEVVFAEPDRVEVQTLLRAAPHQSRIDAPARLVGPRNQVVWRRFLSVDFVNGASPAAEVEIGKVRIAPAVLDTHRRSGGEARRGRFARRLRSRGGRWRILLLALAVLPRHDGL